MKIRIQALSVVLATGITTISCLEPSGEEGSAIAKIAALDAAATEEEAATDGEAAPAAFADISDGLATNCASASCHSTAGGIAPVLESETDLFSAINAVLDPERLAGPISLDTMKGVAGVSPMPPGGSTMEEIDAAFVAQFEAYITANFDETGAPIEQAADPAAP